jgi:hypothetical protein
VNPHRIALPALLFLAAGALDASSFAGASPVSPAAQGHEESALGQAMESIRADVKLIGKGLEAKDQDTAWKAVCSLQQNLLAAKLEVPEKAASVPEAERAAFVGEFRAEISKLLKASCDAETAVLAGKFDEAEKVVKEVIWPMQKPAHKKFRND